MKPGVASLLHKTAQHSNVTFVIARFIHRSFSNKGTVAEAAIIEQPAKWFNTDCSLPDIFMTIQLRTPRSLGVIAVPYPDSLQPHRRLDLSDSSFVAFRSNDVVSRNMRVTRIQTHSHRRSCTKPLHKLRNLLETAS